MQVKHTLASNHVECSCKLFERVGYLCRHTFFALKLGNVFKIPRQHVLNRWMKNAERRASSMSSIGVSKDCNRIEKLGEKVNEIWFNFNACMGLVGNDDEDLDHVGNVLKELKHYLRERRGTNVVSKNKSVVESLIGSDIPEDITVKPPNEARNKGCGRKRIKSAAEKSIIESEKTIRLCRACNELGTHDKRNCPKFKKKKACVE